VPEILNDVLRSLTLTQLDMLRPIEAVTFPEARVIYCQGEQISHLIFCDTGLFSTLRLVVNEANRPVEIWCAGGRCGVIGAHTLLQPAASLYEFVARIEITGWLVRREALHHVMARDVGFAERMQALNRATHATVGQVAACRAIHNYEQRLCRQLLMIRAALETDRIPLQIQVLAEMIPMSRQHLYRVAAGLRDVFRFATPGVEIIDPEALERRACTCFRQADADRAQVIGKP
jgi:CRP-like cAMP-binding protein